MAKLTDPEPLTPVARAAFEAIRSQHRLRALTDAEDGTGIEHLPRGVFGFTYSPCEGNFPLFNDRDLRSFETHKLEDGSVFLLGFLTAEESRSLQDGRENTTIHLFPEPKGDADQLVRVPTTRISSHVENSQRKGTGFEILVAKAG